MSTPKDDARRAYAALKKFQAKQVEMRAIKNSRYGKRPALDSLDDIKPDTLVTCQICFAQVRFIDADRHGNWHGGLIYLKQNEPSTRLTECRICGKTGPECWH